MVWQTAISTLALWFTYITTVLHLECRNDKTTNDTKKKHLRQKASDYMDRAEQMKKLVQKEKEAGTYHEQIHINNNESGYSYEKVFGPFLEDSVTRIEVEDPYIRTIHQTHNFLRFCELLVKRCPDLQEIMLLTGREEHEPTAQEKRFTQLTESLKKHKIVLTVKYSMTLHDREIRLDNFWVIKIGRGLDFFKAAENKFSIGFCDMSLRPCYETTIDIFHRKSIKRD
ncbi:MIT domain-containing protein 1-like isoform X2 [Limulus polyphemus]|uniref:MIT domain-containing protein 1-like isoform X2 n=1 Tax=Limulus polyphemus TaxID=6850 RepID=A0ABM1SKQ5_LIMPO|nr:MIT domain-containing protein 1-like isoform X2 [Limulus polyphemus]